MKEQTKKQTLKRIYSARAALLESIKAKDGQTEFSSDDLEQMRSALLELLNSTQELSGLLSPQGKERVSKALGLEKDEDQFAETRKQIQQMTSQQLTSLRKVLNPSKMRAKLATSRAALDQYKDSMTKASSKTSDTPGLPGINSYCTPLTPEAIIAADSVYFIAEGVRDAAQDGCNEVVVIAGEGGNGRAACLITDATYLIAKAANQAIHFCDDDYAQSVGQASFDRLGHIHSDLESSVANDNTNTTNILNNAATNTTNIINNDNANTTTLDTHATTNTTNIINTDNANTLALTNLINATRTQIINNANDNKDEMKNLLLRTQIEADLSSTDGSAFAALYETPSNVCLPSLNDKGLPQLAASVGAPAPTQCGLLDMVRSIVRDTIANVGAGTNAQSFFASGDAQRAAGKYKAAYTSYRQAYKAAGK